MKLHIFNPGHDEALAANTPYYTHTLAARRLADALWRLPEIWAAPDDVVLNANTITAAQVSWADVEAVEPWGWDAALVHSLRRAGAPERLLPTETELANIRRLSCRRTAVNLLLLLPHDEECRSVWCTSMEQLEACIDDLGTAILKSPWSCSGRGVFSVTKGLDEMNRRRAARILREQGAIEAEVLLERLIDFALEFDITAEGECRYLGLSHFETGERGDYVANILRSEYVATYSFEGFNLSEIIDAIKLELPRLLNGGYIGPVGIDMIVYTYDGQHRVHPCIEVNLRRTMGWVAVQLCRKLSAGVVARFMPNMEGKGWIIEKIE